MRPLRLILVCVLLGAVTTVGVAWGCALRVGDTMSADGPYRYETETELVLVGMLEWKDLGVTRVEMMAGFFGDDHEVAAALGHPGEGVGLAEAESLLDGLVPRWVVEACRTTAPPYVWDDTWEEPIQDRSFDAQGLPLRALWCERVYDHDGAIPDASDLTNWSYGGIRVSPKDEWYGDSRCLALRLIPLGFTVNSVFYGTIWFGIIICPGFVRRRIRKRRGLCPSCAYDMRGCEDVCAECGE